MVQINNPVALGSLVTDMTEVLSRLGDPGAGNLDALIDTMDANIDTLITERSRWALREMDGGGSFFIPAGPTQGTIVASAAAANTYGGWVQLIASTGAALYLVGVLLEAVLATSLTYVELEIAVGGGGSEVSIGEVQKVSAVGAVAEAENAIYFKYPVAVATATRIAARAADNLGSAETARVTLIAINQADLKEFGT